MAEQFAKPPPVLSSDEPMDKTWKSWKQQFMIFMKASGAMKQPDDIKAYTLLNQIGQVGQEAMNNFVFENPDDRENMDALLAKFDDYFDPKKTVTNERYSFFIRSKKNNETIDEYVNALKIKANTCDFDHLTDGLIIVQIALDIKDKALRNILLTEKNLDLNKAIDIWKTHEATHEKLKQMCKETTASKELKQTEPTKQKEAPKQKEANKRKEVKQKNTPSTSNSNPAADFVKIKNNCWRCGKQHAHKQCPAWNHECSKCNELHHFENKCTAYLAKGEQSTAQTKNQRSKNKPQDKNMDKNMMGPFSQIAQKVMNNVVAEMMK